MTKTSMFLFAVLALILTSGAFGQAALSPDGPQVHAVILGSAPGLPLEVTPDATAAATPAAASAMTAMGPLGSDWPDFCGSGSAHCASDPSYSLLLGEPEETWSRATCTSSTTACGQIYNVVVSNTAAGKWSVKLKVKQGTKVIYDTGMLGSGVTFAAGNIGYSYFSVAFGPGDCAKGVTCVAPVAGPATITYTNKIGTTTVTGHQTITLQSRRGCGGLLVCGAEISAKAGSLPRYFKNRSTSSA